MQVAGRVVAKLVQFGGVQEVHRLQQRRPLAPWAAGIEPDVAKRGHGGFVEARLVIAEILGRKDAAILLLKLDDGARDVAAIEGVARGGETDIAPARTNYCLLVRHVLQSGGERLLPEHLARMRGAPF